MMKFSFKTLIFMTQELGNVKKDLSSEIDEKINEVGAQGYDLDALSNEGDFLIVIMKREIRPPVKRPKKKKNPVIIGEQ